MKGVGLLGIRVPLVHSRLAHNLLFHPHQNELLKS